MLTPVLTRRFPWQLTSATTANTTMAIRSTAIERCFADRGESNEGPGPAPGGVFCADFTLPLVLARRMRQWIKLYPRRRSADR